MEKFEQARVEEDKDSSVEETSSPESQGAEDSSSTDVGDVVKSPKAEELALEKAPPPIKTHRELTRAHTASPPELSPPPSPKRMRELEKKEAVFNVIVPAHKLQEQSS